VALADARPGWTRARQAARRFVDGWVSYIRTAASRPEAAGEDGDDPNRGLDAVEVGEDTGEQRPDGEPAVAPQPVDADGLGPPAGVRDIADDG